MLTRNRDSRFTLGIYRFNTEHSEYILDTLKLKFKSNRHLQPTGQKSVQKLRISLGDVTKCIFNYLCISIKRFFNWLIEPNEIFLSSSNFRLSYPGFHRPGNPQPPAVNSPMSCTEAADRWDSEPKHVHVFSFLPWSCDGRGSNIWYLGWERRGSAFRPLWKWYCLCLCLFLGWKKQKCCHLTKAFNLK